MARARASSLLRLDAEMSPSKPAYEARAGMGQADTQAPGAGANFFGGVSLSARRVYFRGKGDAFRLPRLAGCAADS